MTRLCLAALALSLLFVGSASAETRTFNQPRHMGDRLDICMDWGSGCGKPAADAYCQSRGYVRSTGHSIDHDVGASTPTRLLKTGAVCDQGFCDAFRQITCFRPAQEQTFNQPKHMGDRLDICRDWGANCGKPAADAYCQSKGFARSKNYSIDNDIGLTTPTRVISTGARCDQAFCDGFRQITCTN